MIEKKTDETPAVTDDQIVTQRKLSRRGFLATAGTILAGGALALAAGRMASAQQAADPDQKKKKQTDPDQKKKKRTDPDQKKHKRTDPDQKKSKKPAKKKGGGDPDGGN